MRKKAIFYIDGYNWYHAIFKHYPEWKWLNIESFCTSLRPDDDVIAVKVFSAMIDHDKDANERQARYFEALSTLSKVKIILGMFQERIVTCKGECKKPYAIKEEKKTDVNLAIEIMDDAMNDRCNAMYIVSGDSDIQPAVEWVVRNRSGMKMMVYVPALPAEQSVRRTDYYRTKRLNVECKFLPLDNIPHHQMKHTIKIADGKFVARPHLWQREPLASA